MLTEGVGERRPVHFWVQRDRRNQARFLPRPGFGTAIGVIFEGFSRICPVGVYAVLNCHQSRDLAFCKTSNLFQGVESVEICQVGRDRIEKRAIRIEGVSGSLYKGIAHWRSNRSPRARVSMPGNCRVSVIGTMMTRFITAFQRRTPLWPLFPNAQNPPGSRQIRAGSAG